MDGSSLDIPLSVHPRARVVALQSLTAFAEHWLLDNLARAPRELRSQLQVGWLLLPARCSQACAAAAHDRGTAFGHHAVRRGPGAAVS